MLETFNKSARTAAALAALISGTLFADAVATGGVRAQGGPSAYDEPAGEVDLDTFYRELAPHGDWFTHPRWGTVWRPHVDSDWRPYTRGHWANSEEHGWVWVAEEEWGWAPFHYGRWAYDDDEDEWLWIPGTEWAPAWVMWRQSDDLVGWAPLPPDAVWEPGYGLRFSATSYEGPRYYGYWSFVQPEYMFTPGLHRYLVPRDRYRSFWGRTSWVRDHHRVVGGRIYHGGIDRRWVEQRAGRPVPQISLRSVRNPREQGWRASRNPAEIPVYRPRITGVPASTPPDWIRRNAPDRRGPDRDTERRISPGMGQPNGRSVTMPQGPMRPLPGEERRFERRGPSDAPQPPVGRPPSADRFERPAVLPRVIQPPPQPAPTRDVRRDARPEGRPQVQPQPQPDAGRPSSGRERRAPQHQPIEPRG